MVYRVLTNKRNKMKKYFCVETDEIVEFGDVVNLTFTKDLEDGKVTIEKGIEFTKDSMDWLIEMGFVEEREVEKENLLDFEDEPCEALSALEEAFKTLEEKVKLLESLSRDTHTWSNSASEKILSLEDEVVLLKKRVKIVEDLLKTQPKKK